jgi:hypothetical protein
MCVESYDLKARRICALTFVVISREVLRIATYTRKPILYVRFNVLAVDPFKSGSAN